MSALDDAELTSLKGFRGAAPHPVWWPQAGIPGAGVVRRPPDERPKLPLTQCDIATDAKPGGRGGKAGGSRRRRRGGALLPAGVAGVDPTRNSAGC